MVKCIQSYVLRKLFTVTVILSYLDGTRGTSIDIMLLRRDSSTSGGKIQTEPPLDFFLLKDDKLVIGMGVNCAGLVSALS